MGMQICILMKNLSISGTRKMKKDSLVEHSVRFWIIEKVYNDKGKSSTEVL